MNASVKSDDNKVLQDRYENTVEETMQVFEAINKRLKVLEEKETHWKEIQAQVEQHAQKASSKIKLDVGGKVFATYKTTLLNAEGSYFHAMLASGKWKPDEDGMYNMYVLYFK
jgi:glucosamine 6-phosphate synthetase-like amidotransferase/phosphosugar isomerase protein